jgi:phospholipase C
VYDRLHLERAPRRYTVEAGRHLTGVWELGADGGAYDLWVLGPNGFHRHFTGSVPSAPAHRAARPEIEVRYDRARGDVVVSLLNAGNAGCTFQLTANAYSDEQDSIRVGPASATERTLPLRRSAHWYDFSIRVDELPGFVRRFAGRVETGRHSFSDPALGGPALGDR